MALKTLSDVQTIGGFKVRHSIADKDQMKRLNDLDFIEICGNANTITFRIQDGPVKEGGVNGCQVDAILETAGRMIDGLNKPPFNCIENEKAVLHIKEALGWLARRKQVRENKGVEGTSKP